MNQNTCQLRAIIAAKDGGVEAQLLEIDIAARGENIQSLLKALGHAIVSSYEIALDLGDTPFVNLMPAPPSVQGQWREDQSKQVGVIELPPEVARALAIALHFRKPIFSIPVFEKRMAA